MVMMLDLINRFDLLSSLVGQILQLSTSFFAKFFTRGDS